MKMTIEQPALAAALNEAVRFVPKKATMPVLANVLLVAVDDALTISATDMDRHFTITIAADVEAPGSCAVPAHTLGDMVRKQAAATPIYLETDGAAMKLKAGRRRGTLQALPAGDMPDFASFSASVTMNVQSHELADAFSSVGYAASTEDSRYFLKGVNVRATETGLHFTCANGHELATLVRNWGVNSDAPDIIVPTETWPLLVRCVEAHPGDIVMSWNERLVRVDAGPAQITAKLIDGTFPDFERVIPSGNDNIVKIDASDISAAVQFCGSVTPKDGNGHRIQFDFSTDECAVSALGGVGTDSSAEEAFAVQYGGPDISIGTSPTYFANAISGLGDTVELRMADAGTGIVVIDPNDDSIRRVVMPRQR